MGPLHGDDFVASGKVHYCTDEDVHWLAAQPQYCYKRPVARELECNMYNDSFVPSMPLTCEYHSKRVRDCRCQASSSTLSRAVASLSLRLREEFANLCPDAITSMPKSANFSRSRTLPDVPRMVANAFTTLLPSVAVSICDAILAWCSRSAASCLSLSEWSSSLKRRHWPKDCNCAQNSSKRVVLNVVITRTAPHGCVKHFRSCTAVSTA